MKLLPKRDLCGCWKLIKVVDGTAIPLTEEELVAHTAEFDALRQSQTEHEEQLKELRAVAEDLTDALNAVTDWDGTEVGDTLRNLKGILQ